MPESLRIGELAARAGRGIHAIRWYEAQGLIPGVVRDRAGRRVYSELHLSWLDLMDRQPFTKEMAIGIVDVHTHELESVAEAAEGIRKGLRYVTADKLLPHPFGAVRGGVCLRG